MYSMKEKYRQNTNLRYTTSAHSSGSKHYDRDREDFKSRKPPHAGGKTRYFHTDRSRSRSPGYSRDVKNYNSRDGYADKERSRGDTQRSDSKHFRAVEHGQGDFTRRSRIDYLHEDKDYKATKSRRDYSLGKKNSVFADLSRAVQKVRETWNDKRDDDDKDGKRWSHSGYKELYRGGREHKGSNAESHSYARHRRSTSRSKYGNSSNKHPLDRVNSRSRSRSPLHRPTVKTKSVIVPKRTGTGDARNGVPKAASKGLRPDMPNKEKASSGASKLAITGKNTAAGRGKAPGSGLKPLRPKTRESDTSSDSVSASESLKRLRRSANLSRRSASLSLSRSKSKSRSLSASSSSVSSNDEDVLELHPTKKRRTLSKSNSSSSEYESKSDSSAVSCLASNEARKSPSSISSSSGSLSSSISDKSVNKTRTPDKLSKSITPSKAPGKDGTAKNGSARKNLALKLGGSGNKSTKSASNAAKSQQTAKVSDNKLIDKPMTMNSKSLKATSKHSKQNKSTKSGKEKAGAGASESDSDSSSESDGEPRMSLSERFAKLTQMHTDKREFAKPVLSINEIDTKMKVVRDLRNAEPKTKVYLGDEKRSVTPVREIPRRSRPKSPVFSETENGRRYSGYTSDDRRKHFERMDKDEPAERPADWSDPRVRFAYYRDRGYFDERPINFEEYVKWEEWWFKYREWLANEGYYDQLANSQNYGGHRVVQEGAPAPRGWYPDRRNEQPEPHHRGGPPPPHRHFDARERIIRHAPYRGHAPHPYHHQNLTRPPPPITRHIGRAANGSLVINVRPHNMGFQNNFRGRGGRGGYFR